MKNELSVNPTEFGIEEKQANEMVGNLPQIQREAELKAEREKAEQERKRVEAENNAKLDAERKVRSIQKMV